MAYYEIIGTVHEISTTKNIATKSGGTLQKRTLTLIQRRFDQNTGEEFDPNYPSFDFTNRMCTELDKFKIGDRVRVRFDISGTKYNDKHTQEEKYFTSLRAFRIEPYVAQQPYMPPQAYPPQPVQPQGQPAYPPPPQQPYYPPRQASQPAPAAYPPPQPQADPKDRLPF